MDFGISSQSSISTCIRRTITGNYWDLQSGGGSTSYLSDVQCHNFFIMVKQYGCDLNCMKSVQAYSIAFELREFQYERAYTLLKAMKIHFHNFHGLPGALQRAVNSLAPYPPSQQWLYSFCDSNNIILKNQDTLEAIRRANGKKSIIRSFYNKNEGIFNRDARLIWNVDETSSESNKKFKFVY